MFFSRDTATSPLAIPSRLQYRAIISSPSKTYSLPIYAKDVAKAYESGALTYVASTAPRGVPRSLPFIDDEAQVDEDSDSAASGSSENSSSHGF